MGRHCQIGLIIATKLEAKPFILGLGLKELSRAPFAEFSNQSLRLVISGIGKANAAMAATYCICRYHPKWITNLGAAGAAGPGSDLGAIYHIEKVIEPDRPHLRTLTPYEQYPDRLEGFEQADLATQDRPIIDPSARRAVTARLVDMEGAAVVQVCRHFRVKCCLFKFVSDTLAHTHREIIRQNIQTYREPFFTYITDRVLPQLEQDRGMETANEDAVR
jgi:nucleoside phosphorylase